MLKFFNYVNGINDTPFPNEKEQLVIYSFKYEASRMGGAPSISATAKHRLCLDDYWGDNVYVEFRGEKYFIINTPSSKKDNKDERYTHEIELLSERELLNHVYFIDAVQGDSSVDVYKSNTTKVIFTGDIKEFVGRLNASLSYQGLDYNAVIDEGISSEDKTVEFEDKYILEALQEEFNIYEIPYYFVGKVIHFGYTKNTITYPLKYGFNDALLSISKNNANYAVINKIKGVGSSDNIPYYYPNESDDRSEVEASGKKWITPSPNLMPSIYRESGGANQFYEAKNNTYQDGEGGYYVFENEYSDKNQRQGTTDFDEIKPTIKGATNSSGQRIDMFIEFAYDKNDNDEIDEEGNYIHSYFFGKLRKFDGTNGFNLFDHAIESQAMQISFTSGACGACNFEIGVGEGTQKNIVQVDENGDLMYDEETGNVLWENQSPQDRQNDTKNYEVWIALKKDDTTYGQVMPNVTQNLKPSTNDTFVILGIDLPLSYIKAAEKRLDNSLIKYMWMNNREKFTFDIDFSRIFFEENPEILSQLDENSRVLIEYNGKQHTLYIDNFTYNEDGENILPEIKISLVEELTIGKNSLQTQLDSVKQDILSIIGSADFLKQGLKYFLRKDINDVASGRITFAKGLISVLDAIFGNGKASITSQGIAKLIGAIISGDVKSDNFLAGALGTGYGLLKYDQDGKSYLEIDKLFVRLKAIFAVLEIRKLTYAGGNFIFSPAGMDCVSVEEYDTYYRCYFTADDGSSAVENTFEVDDLVRMQEFNIKAGVHENVSNRYFWRRCVGKGENYIDLSKTDRDLSSDDAPQAGDSLVTMGNKTITSRQNVIMISVYGEGSPSFIQYTGINDYSLDGKAKTIISPELNQLTGKFVFSTSGKDVETAITDAVDGVQIGGRNLILNSKLDNSDGWYLNNGGTIVEFGGYKCLKTHGNKSGMYLIYTSENAVNIPQSGKIVSSVDVYATESTVIFLGRGRSENSSINITETNKWIRVYNVQNLTAVNDSYIIYNGGDSVVYFKNVKCEIGNKATDWTPAPEDTESEITTLKEQSAEFETSINGLTSRVEATETTVQGTREDLDNLQIGGRNYIKNSRLDNLTEWGIYNAKASVETLSNVKCVKITSNGSGIYAPFNILNLLYNLVADTNNLYVTSSVDIYSDKQINVDLGIERNDGTKYVLNETNKWVRISTTQKINSEPHAFIIYPRDTTATVYVKNAKLEIGNKATDWTPAPEDLETKIEENKSLIDQKADEISLSVSQEIINKKGNGNNIAICETEIVEIDGVITVLKDVSAIGNVFTLSVETAEKIEGGQGDVMLVYSTGKSGETLQLGRINRTSDVKQTITFTVPDNSMSGGINICASEIISGKTKVTNLKLEYGDTATVWTPSVKDQEKYVDNKTYTETILDLTGSQFDQSKYYPVTIEITAYNVPIEITVTSPLGRDYGVPGWSELGGGFSCEARWTVNNTNVMGVDLNSYIKRNIERFQYDFTEEDAVNGGKVIPLGSIGNLMWNPYEYVYLRGGAKYKFLITNNLVPILHETDATILSEYLWIKTSVEVPQITNVNIDQFESLESDIQILSDKITATSSRVTDVESDLGQLTVSYNQISGTVTNLNSRLGILESAGFIVESDFVTIFAKYEDDLGDKIVSSINVAPEGVSIDAAKINLNGAITANGNVQITTDGKIIAKNAEIEGTITSSSGNIGGWEIKSTSLRSSIFEYPTLDSTGDRLAGGSGSLLSPDGGLMLIPTGSGILAPSTGLMQAALIRTWGSNTSIIGLEIDAKQTNSGLVFNQVVALRLIASHANSNPSERPRAIEIVDGDIIMTGNTIMNGLALNVRTISSSSGSLTKEDDIVFVNYSSSVTISLPSPSSVKKGKMFFIRKTGSGNITIKGTIMMSWTSTTSSVSLNNGKLMIFINHGSYWTQNTIGGEW